MILTPESKKTEEDAASIALAAAQRRVVAYHLGVAARAASRAEAIASVVGDTGAAIGAAIMRQPDILAVKTVNAALDN